MDPISISLKNIQDIPKETTCQSELIYSDEQSLEKCVECKLESNTIRYMNFKNKIIIFFSNSRNGRYYFINNC